MDSASKLTSSFFFIFCVFTFGEVCLLCTWGETLEIRCLMVELWNLIEMEMRKFQRKHWMSCRGPIPRYHSLYWMVKKKTWCMILGVTCFQLNSAILTELRCGIWIVYKLLNICKSGSDLHSLTNTCQNKVTQGMM